MPVQALQISVGEMGGGGGKEGELSCLPGSACHFACKPACCHCGMYVFSPVIPLSVPFLTTYLLIPHTYHVSIPTTSPHHTATILLMIGGNSLTGEGSVALGRRRRRKPWPAMAFLLIQPSCYSPTYSTIALMEEGEEGREVSICQHRFTGKMD